MIEQSTLDSVRVLRMAHGKVNALDVELLGGLRDALAEAERDGVAAIVLTGTGSTFCAGVDLLRTLEGGAAYARTFLPLLSEVLLQWFRCPLPVVAAINGHAIAGGAVLAWCADWRVMSEGGARIGTPELRVGVPFPLVPLEIARYAVPRAHTLDVIYRGLTLTPQGAHTCGLVDDVVPAEQLLEWAATAARELAALPAAAFRLAKASLRRPTVETIANHAAPVDAAALAEWSSDETAARIRAFLDRTIGSRKIGNDL